MGGNRHSPRRALLAFALLALIALLSPRAAVLSAPPLLDGKPAGLSTPTTAPEIKTKIDPRIQADQANQASYFVRLREQADTANQATDWAGRGQIVYGRLMDVVSRTQASLLQYLTEQKAAGRVSEFRSFWIVNGFFVSSDSSVLTELAARDDVAAIWANGVVRSLAISPGERVAPATAVTTPSTAAELLLGTAIVEPGITPAALPGPISGTLPANIAAVRAAEVWERGYRGEGVVVAVLDTGAQLSHPALQGKYRGSGSRGAGQHDYNFWDAVGGRHAGGPYDDGGQGTALLGTILGGEESGPNRIGVAPGAKWIAVKVLDGAGVAREDQVLAAMQWVLAPTRIDGSDPRPELRPHVVANSWGAVCASGVSRQAVQAWVNAGIFPSFATGNSGRGNDIAAPAAYPESFSTGAIDPTTGAMATYSSVGASCYDQEPRPHVLAPGGGIVSSTLGGTYGPAPWGGTAMAQAHVAGVAALLLSARPSLSVSETRNLLTLSERFDVTSGRPIPVLDAVAALSGLAAQPTPSPVATATPSQSPAPVTATTTQPPTTTAVPSASTTQLPTTTAVPPTSTATSTAIPPRASPTTGCQASFTDVGSDHWAQAHIQWMFCAGAISGYSDNTFRPLSLTSRAQFAKMITLASGWRPENPTKPSFKDVPSSFWAYPYIETVRARRIVSGYADRTFRPSDPVTRGQLAKMIVESGGWTLLRPASPSFSDVGPRHWAYGWVETAAAKGVITGYADGAFRPDRFATRAQLSKMIHSAFAGE